MDNLKIIPYNAAFAESFKALNVAWLQKFFYVEPLDEEILGNPKKYILDLGGHIFFAKINDEIVGTIALIKHSEGVFELSKMAVDPGYQGKKIGQKLLEASLEYAKTHHWRTLLLYSNRKLENAIYLYKKFGFKEIEIEKDNPYARGDIKMELLFPKH